MTEEEQREHTREERGFIFKGCLYGLMAGSAIEDAFNLTEDNLSNLTGAIGGAIGLYFALRYDSREESQE